MFHNSGQQSRVGVFDLCKSRLNNTTPTKRIMNVSSLNKVFNIDGPDFIDDILLIEEENIGNWGISGWNHTEEAKKLIGNKNRKYSTEEEKLKALKESRKKTRNKSQYKERRDKWLKENKEKLKEKQLEYDKKHREKNKEYAKNYYKKNKIRILQQAKEKYAASKSK